MSLILRMQRFKIYCGFMIFFAFGNILVELGQFAGSMMGSDMLLFFRDFDSKSGAWALETFLTRPSFFCIFEKSGKNEATDLAVSQLRGSTIAIISAHVPGQHMWASADPGPTTKLTQVLQNSASWMVVLRFTTLSARDRH